MRWLLAKDLRILRRSPLLVALLVVYPVVIALLIGLALSRTPDKPQVAFLNEVPPGAESVNLSGETLDLSKYSEQIFQEVEPIRVDTRAEAVEAVESGDALAAIVVPADIVTKLASGIQQGEIEVLYNGDATKQALVERTIDAELAKANAALAERIRDVAVDSLKLLTDGGRLATPIGTFDLLGLERSRSLLQAAAASLPRGSPQRRGVEDVDRFAFQASEGLSIADGALLTASEPVKAKRTIVSGGAAALDTFAIVVAVTFSLMLVCVLLAAGLLALEREERTFGRLVRGLVRQEALLAEKILLSAVAAALVALGMLSGIGAFVGLEWERFGLWVVALATGGAAFAALGVALGVLAREVRAASLLAILLSLPLAFLALVPDGAVTGAVKALVDGVSAAFPFRPALDALDAAVNDTGSLGAPLAHLALLTLVFAVLARLGLRRFA